MELKDTPDFTAPVFRFLSRTISSIGVLSLFLLLVAPPEHRTTVLWFAALTLSVGGSLYLVRGKAPVDEKSTAYRTAVPLASRHD